MRRAYLSISASEVSQLTDSDLLGQLTEASPFAVEPPQIGAWQYQLQHLRELSAGLPSAVFHLEFLIPRMGRRADLVIIYAGLVFVVEYKVGSRQFDRHAIEQVYGYGLDLKHFHETSHDKPIVPILVATEATTSRRLSPGWDSEQLSHPLLLVPSDLQQVVAEIAADGSRKPFDASAWLSGRYRPTPTIVEAAQALYRGHNVEEISRSEAGAENLTKTAERVFQIIEDAKTNKKKAICFITGVPGAGKSLAGLNIATARQRAHKDEHAVFLSGNGPLVDVLREALAIDAVGQAKAAGGRTTLAQEVRRASAFIQNIHHFRDDALIDRSAPDQRVAVFDEAQRAWDAEQTSRFMQRKRGQAGFSMSEPEFLLSVMDRHEDWCAIICLIGSGQEINTGEAGISEWFRALLSAFPSWTVYAPSAVASSASLLNLVVAEDLHLSTSIRSFRAERLSDFVTAVIEGDAAAARRFASELTQYPLLLTRDISAARDWLRKRKRGGERIGLLASSNGARLKPHGIFVKSKIESTKWFLSESEDIRSSDSLEDAATEFDVQGLELDWGCVCWDANYRRSNSKWAAMQFKGTKWQAVNDETRQRYIANSYRVLLTRARQGLVVFVPSGDENDSTRPTQVYDGILTFLEGCGFEML